MAGSGPPRAAQGVALAAAKRPFAGSCRLIERIRVLSDELAHLWRRAQWIDATLACSLAAGVLKPKVSLGRWFKRSAILSRSD